MAGFIWENKPDIAWSELARSQQQGVEEAVVDLVERMVPEMDDYLNDLVPWHGGEADISEDEPKDLYSYVESVPGQAVYVYMTHWDMPDPEPTLEKELAFVPEAIDYFGPVIMNRIRQMLR
jgi:hypothetical protein